jgi:hypothetical protein
MAANVCDVFASLSGMAAIPRNDEMRPDKPFGNDDSTAKVLITSGRRRVRTDYGKRKSPRRYASRLLSYTESPLLTENTGEPRFLTKPWACL